MMPPGEQPSGEWHTHSDTLMCTLTSAYPINNIKNTWHIKWEMMNLLQARLPSNWERSEICHWHTIITLSKPLKVPWALLPRAKLIKKAYQFLTCTPQHCFWHFRNHLKSARNFSNFFCGAQICHMTFTHSIILTILKPRFPIVLVVIPVH